MSWSPHLNGEIHDVLGPNPSVFTPFRFLLRFISDISFLPFRREEKLHHVSLRTIENSRDARELLGARRQEELAMLPLSTSR